MEEEEDKPLSLSLREQSFLDQAQAQACRRPRGRAKGRGSRPEWSKSGENKEDPKTEERGEEEEI